MQKQRCSRCELDEQTVTVEMGICGTCAAVEAIAILVEAHDCIPQSALRNRVRNVAALIMATEPAAVVAAVDELEQEVP